MIFDAAELAAKQGDSLASMVNLNVDLIVVGSGAGGAPVAALCAEAGLSVVLVEPGGLVLPAMANQREADMLPQLYWESGARMSADRAVHIHQGKGVGGSTLHNLNLCKRIPAPVLRAWRRERGLAYLPESRWDERYAEAERLLEVGPASPQLASEANAVLQRGCEALGWRGGPLRHNRSGCVGSGYCEVGCSFDAKNNALKVFIPRAVKAGAVVLSHCQAIEVLHDGHQVSGVRVRVVQPDGDGATFIIHAPRVCLSASATGTAALLLRSKVPCPDGSVGDNLHIHPAVVAAGEFEQPLHTWRGIPQTWECTELLDFETAHNNKPAPKQGGDGRIWIVPAFSHPMATAAMLPGFGATHVQAMARYPHMMALTAMLHDRTKGRVRPDGELGLRIDYWPNEADRRALSAGLVASARLLFAAGAKRVLVPAAELVVIERVADLPRLAALPVARRQIDITAVHPMASVPMGDDREVAAVDSRGKHHHVEGLWVADGSLFPGSIGVPPQLSIYALGLHVARHLIGI